MKRFIFTILLIFICIFIGFYFVNNVYSKTGNLLGFQGIGQLIDDYKNLEDSGLTGEQITVDENYAIYYQLLTKDGKTLYRQILDNMMHVEEKMVPLIEVDVSDVSDVMDAVMYDHPELFYVDTSYTYRYTKDQVCRQIEISYNDLAIDLEENNQIFSEKVQQILKGANRYEGTFEKEKYIHDYLIDHTNYQLNSPYNQTAYSAIVYGSTVCAGYSKAFQYLMMQLQIPTYYVVGISKGENHAWNMISINQSYYNVDVTWDDSAYSHYTYYNKSDSDFKSHVREGLSTLLPDCLKTYLFPSSKKSVPIKPKEESKTIIPEKKEETPVVKEEKESEEVLEEEEKTEEDVVEEDSIVEENSDEEEIEKIDDAVIE